MKIACFLPAKGTSERIPSKNTILLDGKPLFVHTLEKLVTMDIFDEVYLDSDSDEILNYADYLPYHKLKRDASLASNKTDGHELFANQVANVDADIYVQILCTSPFILPTTIERAVAAVSDKSGRYDSATLVRKEKLYEWNDNKPAYGTGRIPNSVDLPEHIVETMGLYVTNADVAKNMRRRFGDSVCLIEASPIEAVDVNNPVDLDLAMLIASGIRQNENLYLNNIKPHLSSPMLADVLDDLDHRNGVIEEYDCTGHNAPILGRAKTLRLRAVEEGEDWSGIYDALKTYDNILPNDIIVVENEIGEYAYFGELNAHLAIRSGASGAIIGGRTRDSDATKRLAFPVYANGTTCRDVRRRATVDTMNRPIALNGIPIHPGDLIFCDSEGVVVIPKTLEKAVFQKVIEVLKQENSIKREVALNQTTQNIIDQFGVF